MAVLSVIIKAVNAETGIEFGEMETYMRTENWVFHMEVDLSTGQILFTDGNSLRITDGTSITTLCGVPDIEGFVNGSPLISRFNEITGFAQINESAVVLSDSNNHCLRLVDRNSLFTFTFAGECEVPGSQNGQQALFNTPYSVVKDAHSNNLLLTSWTDHSLRSVDIKTQYVELLFSSGLRVPSGLAFDYLNKNLVISNAHFITSYISAEGFDTRLSGTTSPGFSDDSLSLAKYSDPREILYLSENVLIVADKDNHRLRVLNMSTQEVQSICSGVMTSRNGDAATCAMDHPLSLLLLDGKLYAGQAYAIRRMPVDIVIMSTTTGLPTTTSKTITTSTTSTTTSSSATRPTTTTTVIRRTTTTATRPTTTTATRPTTTTATRPTTTTTARPTTTTATRPTTTAATRPTTTTTNNLPSTTTTTTVATTTATPHSSTILITRTATAIPDSSVLTWKTGIVTDGSDTVSSKKMETSSLLHTTTYETQGGIFECRDGLLDREIALISMLIIALVAIVGLVFYIIRMKMNTKKELMDQSYTHLSHTCTCNNGSGASDYTSPIITTAVDESNAYDTIGDIELPARKSNNELYESID